MTRIATVPDLVPVPLLLFSCVENTTFRLRVAPTTTFFAEVFQATLGSLRLMLMAHQMQPTVAGLMAGTVAVV